MACACSVKYKCIVVSYLLDLQVSSYINTILKDVHSQVKYSETFLTGFS